MVYKQAFRVLLPCGEYHISWKEIMKSVPLTNIGLLGLWNKKKALLRSEGIKIGLGLEGQNDYIYITVINLTLVFFFKLT